MSIMLSMPKIVDYLKILTDKELKYFSGHKLGGCFKSTRKALNFKLGKKILEKLLNRFI